MIVVSHDYRAVGHQEPVFALYGHLGDLTDRCKKGDRISQGQEIGVLGRAFTKENGGWPPHLHFQVAMMRGAGLVPYGGRELEGPILNPEVIFGIK